MADKKISQLTAATLPLAGTELLPIVQSGTTDNITVNDLAAGNLKSNDTTGVLQVTGPAAASTRVMTTPNANFTVARTDAAQTFTGNQTFSTSTTVGICRTLSGGISALAAGASTTITLTDSVGVGGGGNLTLTGRSYLASPADVGGFYLITGSTGTIITVAAIANVAITYNMAAKTITITNNAANQFDGFWVVNYRV